MESENPVGFERIAVYYEALANAQKRLEREGPFLRDVMKRAPGNRVLDMACGTGVHSLWFAREGAIVTATDLSDAMVEYASEHRAHARIEYLAADMREPPEGEWDLAVCMGNSLSLLNGEEDLCTVFRKVGQRLSSGGLFLFQVLNYERPQAREPRHRIERSGLGDGALTAVKNLVPQGNFTLLSLSFFLEEAPGRFESTTDTAILRNWTKDELLAIAQETGLENVLIQGDFEGSTFDPLVSSDFIGLVRKP